MQGAFPTKKPAQAGFFAARNGERYAAASQYPALNGLDMRSASGDTSTSLSVGIFSPDSVVATGAATASVP